MSMAQIKFRRDSAANWTAANPVLADGELGFERDTKKAKIGDGATSWSSLAYTFEAGGGGGVTDHGALTGLADDDHSQYHTDARGDIRYTGIAHGSNTSNPHSVTKAQLGLGSVDNTADADKPVSTATQTALNLKQDYDADTAKTDVAQNFTLPQRSALLTDNDGNFDLSAKQNFKCTTSAGLTLTFTNQADGLSGSVYFVNSSSHAIAAHANTKLTTSDLTKLSATGTYRIDYMTDGTNALCSVVGPYL